MGTVSQESTKKSYYELLVDVDARQGQLGYSYTQEMISEESVQIDDQQKNRVINSIQYLASHVPRSVLNRLSREAKSTPLSRRGSLRWSSHHRANHEQQLSKMLEESDDGCGTVESFCCQLSTEDDISEVSGLSDLGFYSGKGYEREQDPFHQAREFEVQIHFDDSPVLSTMDPDFLATAIRVNAQGNPADASEHIDDAVKKPFRQMRRRHSMVSQVSISSHKYFEDSLALPHASRYDAAILFVDISGFTRLSTLLDPESLSKAINEYFQLLVNVVTQHNGDILKFAGDALFAEWKVSSNHSILGKSIETNVRMTVEDCVTSAAICGAKIVSKFGNHLIRRDPKSFTSSYNSERLALNVHGGISFGSLVSVHVGDDENRREYLVLGKAIHCAANAAADACLGELVADHDSIVALSRTCELDSTIEIVGRSNSVIAKHSKIMFTPMDEYTKRYSRESVNPLETRITRLVRGWEMPRLFRYRRLLSLYVHPVVVANDAADFDLLHTVVPSDDRHLKEAELRSICAMFISPEIPLLDLGNDEVDAELLKLLNAVMNLVSNTLGQFGGHLRQYIMDDKGLVLIVTFGLRGSTCPNMVSERAIPSANTMRRKLLSELGLESRIGLTIGSAYCGVVGGLMRHEYAVLGPSVNLAARLMSSLENPGILVDDGIRRMAEKTYSFRALNPVVAKGYSDLVPIFEPLYPLKRRWGRIIPNFVGRTMELQKLLRVATEIMQRRTPSVIALISGESGLGKSALMVHAIENITRHLGSLKKQTVVFKQVSREGDALSPFGAFGSMLIDALARKDTMLESTRKNTSLSHIQRVSSRGNLAKRDSGILSAGALSFHSSLAGSISRFSGNGKERIANLLCSLCVELDAPPSFAELVGHHLLQIDFKPYLNSSKFAGKVPHGKARDSLVLFMTKLFQLCTEDADLVIIAVDNAHLTDDMSWKVLQELFKLDSRHLIIGATRPLPDHNLAIEKTFWEHLNADGIVGNRYLSIALDRLNATETTSLIAKTLRIPENQVDERLSRKIVAQSSGVPHFANVLLECMTKANVLIVPRTGQVMEKKALTTSQVSLAQLMLQKIDGFSGQTRNVLNVAATMGSSFQFGRIVEVMDRLNTSVSTSKRLFESAEESVKALLTQAVEEGILYLENAETYPCNGDAPDLPTNSGSFEDMIFTFTHDVWRSTILNLMLGSLKQSIHRAIALTLEAVMDDSLHNYLSHLRLFSHWKGSGDFPKTVFIALDVGKMFEDLGLSQQCIRLYRDTLDMWNTWGHVKQSLSDLCHGIVNIVTGSEIEAFIKLFTAMGKAFLNLRMLQESVEAYQSALLMLKEAPAGKDLKDRSVAFPVFSGLFILLTMGAIEQDESRTYEQNLVAKFVAEAELHGDPVHYCRALAMQADNLAKLGDYTSALAVHQRLRSLYNLEEHSDAISKFYGSDRAAQNISTSVFWLVENGDMASANATCELIVHELLPKMDPRNVHNSFLMLYPVLWVMKGSGRSLMAKAIFQTYVIDAFDEYFGKEGTTFFLPLFKPLHMLLDLHGNQEQDVEEFDSYLTWSLCEENLAFGSAFTSGLHATGLHATISAEICLLLAKRVDLLVKRADYVKVRETLIQKGLLIAKGAVALAEKKNSAPCLRFARPVLNELEALSKGSSCGGGSLVMKYSI